MSAAAPGISLEDKYALASGRALMNGTQALVRMLLDQRRLDARRGLDTGMFVSGYPGSPLGGLDREIARAGRYLGRAGVVHVPAVNEELAATAVAGSQLLGQLPGRRHDGVTGIWYGKGPGLDRAADAIRHGTVSGTSHLGGAVALIGDDPMCKSSTLASSCEAMCRSLVMPLLAPGSLGDIVRLGLHAVALSRHTGMWAGLKIVADVADASGTVELGTALDEIPDPPERDRGGPPVLLGASSVDAEHDLFTVRLERARAYARDAGLNRIAFEPGRPRLGVVAAGMQYAGLERALADLGLGEAALDALGVRLVRLDLPWPVDRGEMRRLAAGLEEILVLEDKLPFLETLVRDALYGQADAPLVVGKEDEEGRPLLSARGALDVDAIAGAVAARIGVERLAEPARARLAAIDRRALASAVGEALRTPFFCSGCPHNISTRADADQIVGAGIGCHSLIALDPAGIRGRLIGAPQMGGEGAQWLGLAPFTDDAHYVQNMGDGTFHHSGSLAVRAAVAAGAHLTFKLLYNDAIAMTGGQSPAGRMDVPTLTRWLAQEGVARVVVTTDDPAGYDAAGLDPIATVRHRDEFPAVEADLAAVPGVTVLIHDDRCATEKRRLRKRGELAAPAERVWINERVCEGCGDCGSVSSCLSVQPVDTELGRKTRIHQASCNQDFSCLKGDCPSFLRVTPGRPRQRAVPDLPVALPEPRHRPGGEDVLIRMPGVGGTGVVTVSAVLQMAALVDGRWAAGIDQTGLAQRGGPVVSDVRLSSAPVRGALRATAGSADLILGLDLLVSAMPDTLRVADPERTVAVLSTGLVPTAAMVTTGAGARAPEAVERVADATRAADLLTLDAQRVSERLFGDHMPANLVVVGAAYQHGCLPLSAGAIEEAIRLNGVGVAANVAAFRWGRALVVDAAAVEAALAPPPPPAPAPSPAARRILAATGAHGELRRLLEMRVPDLVAYQDARYADRYARSVMSVARIEAARGAPGGSTIAEAYARGLHKLMAFKDEYEVARLHLDAVERTRLEDAFGPDATVEVLLHPPALRSLGMTRKIGFGRTATPMFRALQASRRLRGTRADPFGHAEVRRVERALVGEYRRLVGRALEHLSAETHDAVAEIAALPDLVRGYERIKLANVARFRAEAARRLADLGAARQPVPA